MKQTSALSRYTHILVESFNVIKRPSAVFQEWFQPVKHLPNEPTSEVSVARADPRTSLPTGLVG